jgi:hypothetical protein
MDEPSASLEAGTSDGAELVPGFALNIMMDGVKKDKAKRGSTVMVDIPNVEESEGGAVENLASLPVEGGNATLPSSPVGQWSVDQMEVNTDLMRQERSEKSDKSKAEVKPKTEARQSGWARLRSKTTGPLGIRSQWLETIKAKTAKTEDSEAQGGGSKASGSKARESIQVGKARMMWTDAQRNLKDALKETNGAADPRKIEQLKATAAAAKMVYDEVMARETGSSTLNKNGRASRQPGNSPRRSSFDGNGNRPKVERLRHSTSLDRESSLLQNGADSFGADSKVGMGLLSKLKLTRTRIASKAVGTEDADSIRKQVAANHKKARELGRTGSGTTTSGRGGAWNGTKKKSMFFRSDSKRTGPQVRRQTMAQIRELNNNSDAAQQLAGLKSTITDAFDMEAQMKLAIDKALKDRRGQNAEGDEIIGPAARLTELNWYGLLLVGLCLWFLPLFIVTQGLFANQQYHPESDKDTSNAGPEMWGVFVGAAVISILLWLVLKLKVSSDLLGTEFAGGRFERVALYFLFSVYFLLNAAELVTAYLGIAGPCMLYMTFFLMSFSKLPLNRRLIFAYAMLLFYIITTVPSLLWLDTVSNTRYNAKRRMLHGTAYLVVSFLAAVPMKLQEKLKAREMKLTLHTKALTDAQATKNELSQKLLLNVLPEEIIPRFIALGHQTIQTIKQSYHDEQQSKGKAEKHRNSKSRQSSPAKEQEMAQMGGEAGKDGDDTSRETLKWNSGSSGRRIEQMAERDEGAAEANATPLGLTRHNSSGRDMIAAMKRQSSLSFIPTVVEEGDGDDGSDSDGDVMSKAASKAKRASRASIWTKGRQSTVSNSHGGDDVKSRTTSRATSRATRRTMSGASANGRGMKRVSTSSAIVRKIGPQRTNSGRLLGNMIAAAGQVRAPTKVIADTYHECTILFAYTYGLTELCKDLTTIDAVNVLNEVVCRCDNVAERCHIVKIKTIGTCYMAACGLPSPNPYHAINMVEAAIGIVQEIKKFSEHIRAGDGDDDGSHTLSYKVSGFPVQ